MALSRTKASEVEAERLELAKELADDEGADWAVKYQPGSFGCHELLDRTAQVMDSVDRFVLSHPTCVANPEWFSLAERGFSALFELYQKVGAAHLDVDASPPFPVEGKAPKPSAES